MVIKNMLKEGLARNQEIGKAGSLRSKILRILGVFLARILIVTPITANQVSVLSIISILIAAVLLSLGEFKTSLLAIAILYFGEVLDYTDGVVARHRKKATKMQADFVCRIYHPGMLGFIFAGIGIGTYFATNEPAYIILGFINSLLQQTTVFILELKNAVILNYTENRKRNFKMIREEFIDSSFKKNMAAMSAAPIEWLYFITFVAILFNKIHWYLIFYSVYLFGRLLLYSMYSYKKI